LAKRWSINAVSRPGKPLSMFRDGLPLLPSAASPAEVSPVEYLLVASIVAARRLSKASFEVIATGEKARDPPSRLDRISLLVLFERTVDEGQAAAIVADAKRLCTVTNTIAGAPDIHVTSRTEAAPIPA
jgi:uncharacterized OsmC-like protein